MMERCDFNSLSKSQNGSMEASVEGKDLSLSE